MRLGDPRRMQYCCASSDWTCDFPECGCNLTHDDPPEEKVNTILCPKCGTVLCKRYNFANIYMKVKCDGCKNLYSINVEKNHSTIKMIDD